MKNTKAIISIVRPLNCLITFFTIIVAALICTENVEFKIIIFAGLAGAFVNAGGNIINDYFDIEIDKINRPNRPLPSNNISPRQALKFYLYLTFFAFAIIFNVSKEALLIVIFTSVMMFFYSYKLKRIPLLGNIVVSFFAGLAFLLGSVVAGNIFCGIIPMIFAFLINLMRELIKDIEDIEGDKKTGISTFPIKFGVERTIKLISTIGIVLILSTTLPFLFKIYNLYYFIFVSLFVNGIIVYIIKKLRMDTSQKTIKDASGLLKLGMVLGVIAIFIGIYF